MPTDTKTRVAHLLLTMVFCAAVGQLACDSREPAPTNPIDAQLSDLKNCSGVAEYQHSLKKVVLSLSIGDTSLELQHNIMSYLPEYTEILLLTPDVLVDWVTRAVQGKPYSSRCRIVPFETVKIRDGRFFLVRPEKRQLVQLDAEGSNHARYSSTQWAQDLFEVMKRAGGETVLQISEVYKYYSSVAEKKNASVVADNGYLKEISIFDSEVVRGPLVFQGGNILYSEAMDRRTVFCGGDVLNKTRMVWSSLLGEELPDSRILAMIETIYGTDEVVIASVDAGDRLQPELLYHLDQAMIPLEGGVIGVARVVGETPGEHAEDREEVLVSQFLENLRKKLSSSGFKIIDIDMTSNNLKRSQNYVNAIPFVDLTTQKKTLLMPVFSEQSDFEQEIVKKNIETFESVGYKVISVPTEADKGRGGIHCLVNVLE
jgi:hypothetical protein